jgi:HopA1 effector protein family
MDLNATIRASLAAVRVAPGDATASVAGQSIGPTGPHGLLPALAGALYNAWHAGLALDDPRRVPAALDAAFVDRLSAGVPHRTTATTVVPVSTTDQPVRSIVRLDGVAVRMPAAAFLDATTVALPAVRHGLYPGYLVVDGARGRPGGSGALLRLYVHVTDADLAPAVFHATIAALEARSLPYRVKICAEFPRRDAVVAYLPETAWRSLTGIAADLAGLPGLGAETSLFAKRLAPGIAVAWEPADHRPGMSGLSFGMHRALAVAHGLIVHAGAPARVIRDAAVATALVDAAIDPADPYQNLRPFAI